MSYVIISGAGYEKSESGEKIRPRENGLFRVTPYVSLLHTTNPFLGWLYSGSERLTVYRAKPVRLVEGGMLLDTGELVKADAVVYATGWRPTIDFFDDKEAAQLGIPLDVTQQDVEAEKRWDSLGKTSLAEVKALFPHLAQYPDDPTNESVTTTTPFRLYRQILSPKLLAARDRSITFVGYVSNGQTAFCSELLALWAVAWMEDLLMMPTPSQTDMEQDVARVNAWRTLRYGARGKRDPEIILEVQTLFDLLMKDLGLRPDRKQKGHRIWGGLREWVMPYRASDYAGIVQEFLSQVRT